IPLTFNVFNPVGTVSLPSVGGDYVISVQSTTDSSKYDADGKVQADGTSTVIYTVTHIASGKTADTGSISVVVSTILTHQVPLVIGSSTSAIVTSGKLMEFTFMDDPQWRNAIYSISHNFNYGNGNGNEVDKLNKSIPGILILENATYYYGRFEWTIKAIGYPDTIVTVIN
ncbi:MAG: hypothetical protein WAM41_17140, partial [Psychrobacillus psychrotolerans]|uniref:hemoblobin-interacting domain-containing protein n=1 Tax=Psychrobacillus psychrotolerans TaxID=126156 RepID=UPI003BB19A8F